MIGGPQLNILRKNTPLTQVAPVFPSASRQPCLAGAKRARRIVASHARTRRTSRKWRFKRLQPRKYVQKLPIGYKLGRRTATKWSAPVRDDQSAKCIASPLGYKLIQPSPMVVHSYAWYDATEPAFSWQDNGFKPVECKSRLPPWAQSTKGNRMSFNGNRGFRPFLAQLLNALLACIVRNNLSRSCSRIVALRPPPA